MAIYGCGFISKSDVKNNPVFGKIAQGLQSIFVDRSNPNSRKEVLEKIMERQKLSKEFLDEIKEAKKSNKKIDQIEFINRN